MEKTGRVGEMVEEPEKGEEIKGCSVHQRWLIHNNNVENATVRLQWILVRNVHFFEAPFLYS